MSDIFDVRLPEILPTGKIEVNDERHFYETYAGSNNSVLEEFEYTLDKAPIDEIIEVTGIVDNQTVTFEKGVDYELSNDNERIVWQPDPATRPDAGSYFYVDYRSDSIMSRYIGAGEEEFDSIEEELQEAINSKFIDKASGQELDEIGKLFGVLGKRRGRSDTQYRIYLKSVVQSFISRGTKEGIKLAVSAATGTPIEDISITEDFQNNEYRVNVIPNNPVTGSLIEEVAEIADPSGVELGETGFKVPEDEVVVQDAISISEGTTTAENVTIDDAVTTSQTAVAWDTMNWDTGNWTIQHN